MIRKRCPRCRTDFEVPDKGYSKTFCSRSCSASRNHTTEVKKKISQSLSDTWNKTSEEGKKKKLAALKRGAATVKQNALNRMLECSTEELGPDSRKKKVFLEQGNKCNKCSIEEWQGKPLTFELEHIDGHKHNNKRENLEVICPNCHSQTTTWRGRNNKRY